jgi:hypothetical protein
VPDQTRPDQLGGQFGRLSWFGGWQTGRQPKRSPFSGKTKGETTPTPAKNTCHKLCTLSACRLLLSMGNIAILKQMSERVKHWNTSTWEAGTPHKILRLICRGDSADTALKLIHRYDYILFSFHKTVIQLLQGIINGPDKPGQRNKLKSFVPTPKAILSTDSHHTFALHYGEQPLLEPVLSASTAFSGFCTSKKEGQAQAGPEQYHAATVQTSWCTASRGSSIRWKWQGSSPWHGPQ